MSINGTRCIRVDPCRIRRIIVTDRVRVTEHDNPRTVNRYIRCGKWTQTRRPILILFGDNQAIDIDCDVKRGSPPNAKCKSRADDDRTTASSAIPERRIAFNASAPDESCPPFACLLSVTYESASIRRRQSFPGVGGRHLDPPDLENRHCNIDLDISLPAEYAQQCRGWVVVVDASRDSICSICRI